MSETSTEKQERVESISSSYRQRAEALTTARQEGAVRDADAEVEAAKARLAAAEEKRSALDSEDSEPEADEPGGDELPTMSWTRDDIVDYLVRNGVIESADDVDGQKKAELLDNFVDAEG